MGQSCPNLVGVIAMAKATKQASKQEPVTVEEKGAPSPETLAAIPKGKGGKSARPTMKKDADAESKLPADVQGAVTDSRTKAQIVHEDVNLAIGAVEEFQTKLWGGRVGPNGTWTTLVSRFVFTAKDWLDIRSLFFSTLTASLRHKAEQENPISNFPGMAEEVWRSMIAEMVTQQTKKGTYRSVLSEFDVIGRAFKVDKNKKLIGCGRDKLLSILMGAEDAKGNKLPAPPGYQKVLAQAREAVGKDNRGRKAGTTNNNPGTGTEKAADAAKAEASSMEVIADRDKASQMARESCVRNIKTFLDSLPNDAELLLPVVHALGNKLKASNHKDAVDLGMLMLDLVIGVVPADEAKAA